MTSVLSTVDLEVVLERVARLLRRHFGATRIALHRRLDAQTGEVLLIDDPRLPYPARGHRFDLRRSIVGAALDRRAAVVVEHLDPAARRFEEERRLALAGYGSLACFPLILDRNPIGVLEIAHDPADGMMELCYHHAERVARLVAIALHNSLMVEEVHRLNRLLARENADLKAQVARGQGGYVAEGAAMRRIMEQARRVAATDAAVLIRGETGTGKEGLARFIHEQSPRAAGLFVVVNLGAIPEGLIESELFGHEKGAFTGATGRKRGQFERAHGGTLLLDEVGDAPPSVQVRLLRALQEHRIRRVGGGEEIGVDVRVIAATHRPLEEMVAQGRFREDLYYRINAFPIHLPPLRERPDDLEPLVRHLVARIARRLNRRPPAVSGAVVERLRAYPWPGNVRELENFLERAMILGPPEELVVPDLPGTAAAGAQEEEPVPTFEEGVRALLERALRRSGGKIYGPDGAAALLGLKPTTLQGKLQRYGVQVAGRRGRRRRAAAPSG
ncbi:MAG: GAF domain-containing protein [Nitrospirae bacterium]|nr:MAG: GAF domain-containing protein [Nitrospirota bacterium]